MLGGGAGVSVGGKEAVRVLLVGASRPAEAEAHADSQRQSMKLPISRRVKPGPGRNPGLIISPFYLYNSRQSIKCKEQENQHAI